MDTTVETTRKGGLGVVGPVLWLLTVAAAVVFASVTDPVVAGSAQVAAHLLAFTAVVASVRRFRPPHPWFWRGAAAYFGFSVVAALCAIVSAATGAPPVAELMRFLAVVLSSAAIVVCAWTLLIRRHRHRADWAIADAVVIGTAAAVTLLLVNVLPLYADLGPTVTFWADGVVLGVRELVMIAVSIVLLYSERINSAPIALLISVLLVRALAEPVLIQVSTSSPDAAAITVLKVVFACCTVVVVGIAVHPSMTCLTEPHGDPRPTWTVGRTVGLAASLVAPVLAFWFRPPTTPAELTVALTALAVLLVVVVLRLRVSVLQAHRLLVRVEKFADRDQLTGLPNRRYLYGTWLRELRGWSTSDQPREVVLSYLDLDNLREVNTRLEHVGGDELLRAVARALQQPPAENRQVVRVGGDEFVVLTVLPDGADLAAAAAASETSILGALDELAAGGLDSRGSVGTSVGRWDPATEPNLERLLDRLLQEADLAQARAKRAGGGQGRVYRPAMGERARRRTELRRSLPTAWSRGQMALAYQSVVDLRTGEIFGAECLLRWQHPELGPIPPADAIEIAIDLGVMTTFGLQILTSARDEATHTVLDDRVRFGVNVAAPQLRQGALEQLMTTVQERGMAGRVWLEVTEQLLVQEQPYVAAALAELRAAGVLIAVDDFGTGYCGLDYLCSLPIDLIKLDKVFALGTDSAVRRQVSRSVNDIAAVLGAEVIAEGIETAGAALIMRDLGSGFGQGYGLRRPVPDLAAALAPLDGDERWPRTGAVFGGAP